MNTKNKKKSNKNKTLKKSKSNKNKTLKKLDKIKH
jgi:hypothetical protein